MNNYQRLWWDQSLSDQSLFELLRGSGVAQCQIHHYLQMATENRAKAYFWRDGVAPPKGHVLLARKGPTRR